MCTGSLVPKTRYTTSSKFTPNTISTCRHLKQHFEDKIEINNQTFDATHSKFYYFNLHNLNKDAYIDGLELMKGITHVHGGEALPNPMSDEEIEMMIDVVLNDFDKNGDGLVDYAEYIAKTDRD
jgi:Ca2+-binding EF-hand superfamily protein